MRLPTLSVLVDLRPDRRTWIAFGWGLGLSGGLLFGLAGLIHAGWLAPAVAWLLVCGATATLAPGLWARPYDLWSRAASRFARLGRRWVLAVLLHVVFRAVGLAGSRLVRSRHAGASGWTPRTSLDPASYSSASAGAAARPRSGFLSNLVALAREPGNLWIVPLVPLFVLLRALDRWDEVELPRNIYTLY